MVGGGGGENMMAEERQEIRRAEGRRNRSASLPNVLHIEVPR